MQLMGLTISPLAPAVLFEQYRSGPADVVVVCADGLMMVPSSATLRPPSPLATESIGAHLWQAVRLPLLALTPSPLFNQRTIH